MNKTRIVFAVVSVTAAAALTFIASRKLALKLEEKQSLWKDDIARRASLIAANR